MTVDVEDYFQLSAFEQHVRRDRWEELPARVEGNTLRILDLFAEHGVKATFFMLGWVATRYPALVRRIVEFGHELASHGFSHVRATQQTPEAFRAEQADTKALLEDISGMPLKGYRAASFSIGRGNLWTLEVLRELGYLYSSSIYPVRHDLYGMPEAPRFPFRYQGDGILEVPISTVRLFGHNFPCGGGGYFRLLPYAYFRWSIGRVNRVDRAPSVFYFHPWEIDPDQPRPSGLSYRTRIRHYTNLDRMEGRLKRLLEDFSWNRMDTLFVGHGDYDGGESTSR